MGFWKFCGDEGKYVRTQRLSGRDDCPQISELSDDFKSKSDKHSTFSRRY